LYITSLSSRTRSSDLQRRFGRIGEVKNVKLVTDPRTGESRGFGFVTMATVKDADEALDKFNQSEMDGRIVVVEKVLFSLVVDFVVMLPNF